MYLEKLRLTNFRCFGPREEEICFESGITVLIGANGSGKTAAMVALLRLVGSSVETRRVVRRDFHVPRDETASPDHRTLSVDATFVFPDLDLEDGPESKSSAVATFFEHMAVAEDGQLKLRLRLDATWSDNGTDEGLVEERVRTIRTFAAKFDESADCTVISAHDRSRIQLVYIPASRDGASQLTSFLRSRLWRAIQWSPALRTAHLDSAGVLNTAFAGEAAVQGIARALGERWRALHTGGIDATPVLNPVDVAFDRFIARIEVAFHPDETGRMRDLHELSDGQRSLFHLALVSTALDVEASAMTSTTGFDPDSLAAPALTLLAFEEPENNLAPFFLSRIIQQLQALTVKYGCQAVVSSHSASILGRISPEQVRHFRLDDRSRTAHVSRIVLPDEVEDASKFVREAVRAYPELYFASFVILGEGSSEEVVIPRVAEALGFAIDRSFVAVVPLGGRHVEHLWRLLRGLGIPFATLLDYDFARAGGGWGRIKNACKQLAAVGISVDPTLGDPRDAENEQRSNEEWIAELQRHGVFFCTPLDLDMTMLQAFPNEYRALESGMSGPNAAGDAARSVLGPTGNVAAYDAKTWDDAFHWYRYLFLNRGKPSTHIRILGALAAKTLAAGCPEVLKKLVEYVARALQLEAVGAS